MPALEALHVLPAWEYDLLVEALGGQEPDYADDSLDLDPTHDDGPLPERADGRSAWEVPEGLRGLGG